MPWKECNQMDERLRLVARLLEGEKMAAVCREFGISRKTGYKIFNRYKEMGLQGLENQCRTLMQSWKQFGQHRNNLHEEWCRDWHLPMLTFH